jgi:Holliday junction resolvasome RuvABC endonuclease subunit
MNEYILGLDVSTSRVGIAILNPNGNLIDCQVIKLNSKDTLEERCFTVERFLEVKYAKYYIKQIYIEAPFVMFSGGKTTAMTMAKLQRFNGMVSWMVRNLYGIIAEPIAANKARGLVGLKIKRGENTKLKVIEWVKSEYPKDFIVELTRHGNPKPGTDDMADSIVIARAGLKLEKK